ncbi:MFS transporter [Oscillochloris sp. ZM17-4]|uniref:MFS transporter n=1 Tax=Oscillochloris sp. ZM17-4 TaxID=2866714 RepID=UPI001C72A576|nr:MFS transporter [Oscillochloris sp. ZM17-4]MBX0329587.1 MFS transporter [Oscillochloris sp. ZM17-4]
MIAGANAAAMDTVARRRILTVLFVGVFMAALDAAIIAPAIPALRAAFGVDNSQIGLVTIVFGLCTLTSTALMASLSDRYGHRPVYLINIAGFAAGSLLIALSPSFGVVLLGRAIQGFSAGGITPTASAVVGDAFPPEERGKILGLIGATFGMAFLVGPLVASLMLIALSWQWIFLINLPVAAVILWMGARALPAPHAAASLPPFDYAGIGVVAVMLTSLTLGINRVLDTALGLTIWPGLLGLAAVCVPLLIWVESRAAQPIVPLKLFSTRQLVTTYLLCVGAGFGMGSVIFIASVAVAAFDTPAQQAGFLLIPMVICSSAASMGFGRLLNQLGARSVMLIGFSILAAGAAMIGLAAAQFWLYMLATLLIGTGVGVVVGGTLRTVVLDEVQPHERGVAQGLVNIGIAVGNLLVVAVLGALADSAGGGLAGLGTAYLAAAGVMVLMMLASFGLRPRLAS